MDGTAVIKYLKSKLGHQTDQYLADRLGTSLPNIGLWKKRTTATPLQIAGLVATAVKTAETRGAKKAEADAMTSIVEFFPLAKCESRSGNKYELFPREGHRYLDGLYEELKKHRGVYVFSDSRGNAIYVGKARDQSLWNEMNSAFNRQRDVQKIMKVVHPERNQIFATSNEQKRQIKPVTVKLHQIAAYVSAYQVADGMINNLEAMLVRCFANDLLNVRMEKLS